MAAKKKGGGAIAPPAPPPPRSATVVSRSPPVAVLLLVSMILENTSQTLRTIATQQKVQVVLTLVWSCQFHKIFKINDVITVPLSHVHTLPQHSLPTLTIYNFQSCKQSLMDAPHQDLHKWSSIGAVSCYLITETLVPHSLYSSILLRYSPLF